MSLIEKLENNIYKVQEKIGEGGNGEIFTVQINGTNEIAAMKVTRFASKELCRENYHQEVKIMQKVNNHENIVKMIDNYVIDNEYGVIVMERMEMDLMDYILEPPRLCIKEVHFIFTELCKAVIHLHQQSISHCDIKPENVLLNFENGKVKQVKLCDFGAARDQKFDKTKRVVQFGTRQYLSFEVLNIFQGSEEEIEYEKVDIWSLGVLLFVILTGLFPFIERHQTIFSVDYTHLSLKMMKFKFDQSESLEKILEMNEEKWKNIFNLIFQLNIHSRPSIDQLYQLISDIQFNTDNNNDDQLNRGEKELRSCFMNKKNVKSLKLQLKKKIMKFLNQYL